MQVCEASRTGVASFALGFETAGEAGAGVDLLRLADDETILNQLADVLAGVGHTDLVDLWDEK